MPLWWGGGARAAFLLGSGGGCGCGGRRESGSTSTSLRLRSMAGVDSRSAKLGARPRPTFLQWCLRPGLRVGHLLRLDKACGRWSFVRSWAMAMATAVAATASSDGAAGWGKGPGTCLQFLFFVVALFAKCGGQLTPVSRMYLYLYRPCMFSLSFNTGTFDKKKTPTPEYPTRPP